MLRLRWIDMEPHKPCLEGIERLWDLPSSAAHPSIEFVVVPEPSEYTQTFVIRPCSCGNSACSMRRIIPKNTGPYSHSLRHYINEDNAAWAAINRLPMHTPIHVELHYTEVSA